VGAWRPTDVFELRCVGCKRPKVQGRHFVRKAKKIKALKDIATSPTQMDRTDGILRRRRYAATYRAQHGADLRAYQKEYQAKNRWRYRESVGQSVARNYLLRKEMARQRMILLN
jgi:hypothetical protein